VYPVEFSPYPARKNGPKVKGLKKKMEERELDLETGTILNLREDGDVEPKVSKKKREKAVKNPPGTNIYQFHSSTGALLNRYASLADAARAVGNGKTTGHANIGKCARGEVRYNNAYGFKWSYSLPPGMEGQDIPITTVDSHCEVVVVTVQAEPATDDDDFVDVLVVDNGDARLAL
jgi:hypothetical protein